MAPNAAAHQRAAAGITKRRPSFFFFTEEESGLEELTRHDWTGMPHLQLLLHVGCRLATDRRVQGSFNGRGRRPWQLNKKGQATNWLRAPSGQGALPGQRGLHPPPLQPGSALGLFLGVPLLPLLHRSDCQGFPVLSLLLCKKPLCFFLPHTQCCHQLLTQLSAKLLEEATRSAQPLPHS